MEDEPEPFRMSTHPEQDAEPDDPGGSPDAADTPPADTPPADATPAEARPDDGGFRELVQDETAAMWGDDGFDAATVWETTDDEDDVWDLDIDEDEAWGERATTPGEPAPVEERDGSPPSRDDDSTPPSPGAVDDEPAPFTFSVGDAGEIERVNEPPEDVDPAEAGPAVRPPDDPTVDVDEPVGDSPTGWATEVDEEQVDQWAATAAQPEHWPTDLLEDDGPRATADASADDDWVDAANADGIWTFAVGDAGDEDDEPLAERDPRPDTGWRDLDAEREPRWAVPRSPLRRDTHTPAPEPAAAPADSSSPPVVEQDDEAFLDAFDHLDEEQGSDLDALPPPRSQPDDEHVDAADDHADTEDDDTEPSDAAAAARSVMEPGSVAFSSGSSKKKRRFFG